MMGDVIKIESSSANARLSRRSLRFLLFLCTCAQISGKFPNFSNPKLFRKVLFLSAALHHFNSSLALAGEESGIWALDSEVT